MATKRTDVDRVLVPLADPTLRDRLDAGRRLADRLADRLGDLRSEDVVVLALPRGGVPVAAEVARALGAPLDVIVVRKLGVPFQPELALGAARVVLAVPVASAKAEAARRQTPQTGEPANPQGPPPVQDSEADRSG